MKTPFKELKRRSKRALLGNYGTVIGAFFIMYIIMVGIMLVLEFVLAGCMSVSMIFSTIGSSGGGIDGTGIMITYILIMLLFLFALFIVAFLFIPGQNKLYMNICKREPSQISDIFFGFRNHIGRNIGIAVFISVLYVILMCPSIFLSVAATMTFDSGFYVIFQGLYYIVLSIGSIYVGMTYGLFFFILAEDPDKKVMAALKESKYLMRGNRWRLFGLSLSFLGIIALVYITCGIGMLWVTPYIACTQIAFYLELKAGKQLNSSL